MGKYIYCVIKKPESFDFDLCGVGGGKIHLVSCEKLSAVVSDSPVEDYPITRENTITHQQVIEKVMQKHSPALPVSFGTVAENVDVIKEKILETKQDKLFEALRHIEGKIELNIKAIWLDMPSAFQKVVAENPDLALLKKEFAGKRLGMDTTIKIGKMVEDGLRARRNKIREEILSLFEGIVVEHKDTPCLGEQMIFNIAVLILENKQKAFDKAVRDLDEKYKEENAYFKYIGPTPPFNFVKVRISLT